MTGHQYATLIAHYIWHNFRDRGLRIYREISLGKSIIGKNRRIDLFLISEKDNSAFAIECKFQDSQGTVEEKIPYALNDLMAMPMKGCIVYAGNGFSKGVLHMLEASELAAYCCPDAMNLASGDRTKEFDHLLAMHFGWWDIAVAGKKPWSPQYIYEDKVEEHTDEQGQIILNTY
jgi:hypothetical protein